jgi:hypothetical protein
MRRTTGLAWTALTTCVLGATLAAACGGNAFTTGGEGPSDGSTNDTASPPGPDGALGDGRAADGNGGGGDGAPGTDGGPSTDGATPPPDGGSITVSGTVVDALLVPLTGVTVRIGTASASTDASGAFTLAGVAYPYSAIVITGGGAAGGSTSPNKHGYAFTGLQRPDPTLQLLFDQAPGTQSATMQGNTYSGNTPKTGGIVFADIAAPARDVGPNIAQVSPSSTGNNFSGPVTWLGASTASATLYDLQWFLMPDGGPPNTFLAYTSETTSFASGQTQTWDTPATPVLMQNGTLTVNAVVTSGYGLAATTAYLRPMGASIAAPFATMTAPPSGVSIPTPNIQGATFVACAIQGLLAEADAGSNTPYGVACATGLGGTQSTQLAPPAATTLVNPPTMANVATTFTFNAIPNGINLVAFEPTVATDPALYVLTGFNAVRIPDLSVFGAGLRSMAQYRATAYGFAPFAHIGDAVGPSGYGAMAVALRRNQGPAGDGQFAFGGSATFTAQ